MRLIGASDIDAALSYPALVDILAAAFRDGAIAPPRHHHTIALDARPDATWLLMPAVSAQHTPDGRVVAGRYMGLKSVTVFPDNASRSGRPAVAGTYLLLSTENGETLAVLDATRLTPWRTAATSALAAHHLARPDTETMLMVGAGALAPFLIRAHASIRPIRRVTLWNRTRATAVALLPSLVSTGLDISVTDDLEAAARAADLISTATLSRTPLIRGAWLKPGTHVDCARRLPPRHARDRRRSRCCRPRLRRHPRGRIGEAGDLLQPIAAGRINKAHVLADLAELARATHPGRRSADEITLFKSVGASLKDLAAAIAVYERIGQCGSA